MNTQFIKQFALTKNQGAIFDDFLNEIAYEKINGYDGGEWGKKKMDGKTILLIPGNSKEITISTGFDEVTTDRITASVAFTYILVNWFWNQLSDKFSDDQNDKFMGFYFGLRDYVYASNSTHGINMDDFFKLTD
jgi:hypothetical protein